MTITNLHRAVGLIGIAVGGPLIALVTSALATANPDYIVYDEVTSNGPFPQPGAETFTGNVKDLTATTVGLHGDGLIGNWIATTQLFAGMEINSGTYDYELYANGADTNDYMETFSNSVYSEALSTQLWGSTFTEELNSSGAMIGMEDIVHMFGQDFTLFDTLPPV